MNFFKKKKAETTHNQLRDLEALFKNGQIFKATDEELKNAIKEIGNLTDQSLIVQNRNLIRALVINNIQNQKHLDKIDERNGYLTWIIIIPTAINLFLFIYYSRILAAPVIDQQNKNNHDAYQFCIANPSGIWPLADGGVTDCASVLRLLKGTPQPNKD
jgi:hypothetical protein